MAEAARSPFRGRDGATHRALSSSLVFGLLSGVGVGLDEGLAIGLTVRASLEGSRSASYSGSYLEFRSGSLMCGAYRSPQRRTVTPRLVYRRDVRSHLVSGLMVGLIGGIVGGIFGWLTGPWPTRAALGLATVRTGCSDRRSG